MKDYKMMGLMRKLQKDTDIDNNIDLYNTIEGNLIRLNQMGIKVSKKRLLKFLNEYGISMQTQKQRNYQKVIDIYLIYPHLSSRKLEYLCKLNGINVSYRTIQKLIKNHKS